MLIVRAANRIHIDHAGEIAHVSVEIIVPVRRGGAKRLLERDSFHAPEAALRNSLALASIQSVMSSSAGPPLGGLYLKPPSSGGLCEGVMTMPSASPVLRPRL